VRGWHALAWRVPGGDAVIASLRGVLQELGTDHAVVEVHGVGLLVLAPRPVLRGLGALGTEVAFATSLQVREDSLTLYGFADAEQRRVFELLLGVSGVGPKVALALLSSLDAAALRQAIASGDLVRLARVPGIGKKTAERLVLELRGKLGPASATVAASATAALDGELAGLLVSLGFSQAEAATAVAALPADAPTELDERLRHALRFFGGA
jgi:Holliday junction DNA helicase RuvA